MNHKKTLAIILLVAFILRLTYIFIIPLYEKPDEEAHFEYIKFIADNKKLPVQQENQGGAEFFQPPFYHFIASFLLSFVRIFSQDISHQVYFFRIISALISILTLYLVYKVAFLIFKNQNFSLAALIFAAFLPSHINMNTSVTNSNFGDMLSVLIIYILLLIIFKSEDKKKIYLLGIVSGISLITRLSIISAIATIPFAYLTKNYPKIRKVIKPLLVIGIIALIISSWHFARNYNLYGDFLGLNAVKLSSPRDVIEFDLLFIARLVGWTLITFWAAFGRTNGVFIGNVTSSIGFTIFLTFFLIFLLLSFCSAYGLYIFFKNHKRYRKVSDTKQKKALVVMIFHLIVLTFLFISFNITDFQPQGRLFFPAIATISIFFTLGIYTLFNAENKSKFLFHYSILFILMNIASISSIIIYY